MSTSPLHRVWQGIVAVAAIALVVWLAIGSRVDPIAALLLSGLVLIASLLRIDAGEETAAFEASVLFGALIVFHDALIVLVAAALGGAAYWLLTSIRSKEASLPTAYRAAGLAIASYVVAVLYTAAVAEDARPSSKIAGYVLLVVGYIVVQLLALTVRRAKEGDSKPVDFRRLAIVQGRMLLLISAIVATEVLLYRSLGLAGFAIGFLPMVFVAHAMQNETEAGRLNRELTRRNKEQSILTENSTRILSAESDEETLQRLWGLLSRLAKLKASAVVTWSPNPDTPSTVYRFGECLRSDQEILKWVDAAGLAQSAPSRPFVFRDDLRRFPLSEGTGVQVLIGIQTPEVIYGILIYETEDTSILKSESLNLVTLLVNQTALSIQDHLLRREMREKNTELESRARTTRAVLDVFTTVLQQLNVDHALTQIAMAIRRALEFDVVVFVLRDPKTGEFLRRAHVGADEFWEEARKKRISREQVESYFRPEFMTSRSYYVPNSAMRQSEHDVFVIADEATSPIVEEWHPNDTLIVPLQSGEELIGYLSVREPQEKKRPPTERVEALEVFALQAVTALQLIRQVEEIERLTIVDSLTDAHNHRHFLQRLHEEIKRRERALDAPFAVALFDIDNFKAINDTWGHPAGDEMLRGLVRLLRSRKRETDLVARYGGEEFAMILPDADAAAALEAVNRFRQAVAETPIRIDALDRSLSMTVSAGVAIFPTDGTTDAQLIARADAALYHAKKTGKNRVSVAADVITAAPQSA